VADGDEDEDKPVGMRTFDAGGLIDNPYKSKFIG
jgi:hypothetical protein